MISSGALRLEQVQMNTQCLGYSMSRPERLGLKDWVTMAYDQYSI